MENPTYHGEVTTITPDRQQTLAVDIVLGPYARGLRDLVRLSTWDQPDAHDPAARADLCPSDARSLAGHLLNAASLAEEAATDVRAGIVGVRRLPTITVCGTRLVIDERLRQLRDAEDPARFLDLGGPGA